MKKIYTLLGATLIASASFAQVNTAIPQDERSFVTPEEQRLLDQFTIQKKNEIKTAASQTNKGGVINGRVDYAVQLLDILGGATVEYSFRNPMMPDSTTTTTFPSTTVNNTVHGVGMVYDPTDNYFGTEQFAATDNVTVDSLFIDGFYQIHNTAHTNDSLIFNVYVGPATGSLFEVISFAKTGLGFTGTGNINIPYLKYRGSAAHGTYNGLTATSTARYGYRLLQADSNGTAAIAVSTAGLTIPAGSVMGVFVEYIPTSFSAGDNTNYVTGINGDYNPFRVLTLYNTSDTDTKRNSLTGLDNGSYQHNSIAVDNRIRYSSTATNTADLGGGFYAVSTATNSIYAHVSGNSTVGINEVNNGVKFNVYPNPSNGVFNINLSSYDANKVNLTVKNIVGQTVLTETVTITGTTNHKISLTDYSKGIYFLTVGNETVKLIVE